MPKKDFLRLSKYAVEENDLLITVVGTLGNVAIVPEGIKGIFSCKSTIFRESTILPTYLLAYFNSKYGKECLLRRQRGAVQAGLNKEDLKTVPVPIFGDTIQKKIGEKVSKAIKLDYDSQILYKQATTLLEKELGLDKITFEKPKSYTASFSEVLGLSRIDGEHFQPKFKRIKEIIESYQNGYERLSSNIKVVKSDYQLKVHPTNTIQYIELSNISPTMGFINQIDEMDVKNAPSRAKRMVFTGDVIASSVVGSVDKAGLVSETENGYIASNGFFQFRSDYYSPEFLLLLIKSNFVKEQFHQQSTGGILSAVPDQNLKYIIIPKIDIVLQNQITDLVRESHIKVKESKSLLEQAKNRVEELIEEAAKK
jgi:restriction endonuclease S subunit